MLETLILEKLFNKPSKLSLMAMNILIPLYMPFNTGFKFKILELSTTQVKVKLPFRRSNKNHIGTLHACALATLGEYCSGLNIFKFMTPVKFRLVLSEMNVKYHSKARGDVFGIAKIDRNEINSLKEKLEVDNCFLHDFVTDIFSIDSTHIATIICKWHVKK